MDTVIKCLLHTLIPWTNPPTTNSQLVLYFVRQWTLRHAEYFLRWMRDFPDLVLSRKRRSHCCLSDDLVISTTWEYRQKKKKHSSLVGETERFHGKILRFLQSPSPKHWITKTFYSQSGKRLAHFSCTCSAEKKSFTKLDHLFKFRVPFRDRLNFRTKGNLKSRHTSESNLLIWG